MIAPMLQRDGYQVLRNVVPTDLRARTIEAFATADISRAARSGETFGARNILTMPDVQALAGLELVRRFVGEAIGDKPNVVRGIFFDKTPGANWPVAWHQDLSLALQEKRETNGWHAWSIKAGVAHVQPPPDVLARMVTLRFHLDDCGEESGPLRVVPGSHSHGRLDRERQANLRSETGERAICVGAGDVIAMRPLVLHASSAATAPSHRRVVHLEFAPDDLLPDGLRWHTAISLST